MTFPTEYRHPVPRWQATLVLVGGIVVSILLWLALNHREDVYFASNATREAQSIQHELVSRLDSRVQSLTRMARRSARVEEISRAEWENDAWLLYERDRGYQAIERVGPDGVIQWVFPTEGNEKASGFDMLKVGQRAKALETARQQRSVASTGQLPLTSGGIGFLLMVPIYRDADFHGWIVGVYRTTDLLSSILQTMSLEEFEVSITSADQVLYAAGDAGSRGSRPIGEAFVGDYSLNWTIRAWPSQEMYTRERSVWPHGVLAGGVVMSLLAAISIHLAQTARQRSSEMEQLNRELQVEVQQRQVAEDELQRTAERLEVSNRELQDFASVASHDLQEPLRKIQAFGDRLRVKCALALSEDGKDYLSRMQNAAQRMQTLINDLLTFSRVTSKAQPFEMTDLNEVVRGVMSDLEVRLEQTGGTIQVGKLPCVEADPLQMRQLFQNLIGNGLKFRRMETPVVVQIQANELGRPNALPGQTADPSTGETSAWIQITVTDNGIGFDEKYLDRIFTVFQRLHGRTAYEGTGIGLAVCRKIVERHGGSITAHSTLGAGSSFVILLPKCHPHDHGVSS